MQYKIRMTRNKLTIAIKKVRCKLNWSHVKGDINSELQNVNSELRESKTVKFQLEITLKKSESQFLNLQLQDINSELWNVNSELLESRNAKCKLIKNIAKCKILQEEESELLTQNCEKIRIVRYNLWNLFFFLTIFIAQFFFFQNYEKHCLNCEIKVVVTFVFFILWQKWASILLFIKHSLL